MAIEPTPLCLLLIFALKLLQDIVPLADRVAVSRLRNCVTSLAAADVMLWDTSLTYAYEASLKFQPQDMLRPEVMAEVADLTKDQIRMEMMEH